VVDGVDIAPLERERLAEMRRKVQMIFQDPYGSLNPRSTVGRSVAQPLVIAGWQQGATAERVDTLLRWVGLPADAKQRYPHEFSAASASASALPGRWRSVPSSSSATSRSRRSTSRCALR